MGGGSAGAVVGDYVVPNVLSSIDLVSRPGNMDKNCTIHKLNLIC